VLGGTPICSVTSEIIILDVSKPWYFVESLAERNFTASFRLSTVGLEIERPFTDEELVRRIIRIGGNRSLQDIEVVNRYGRRKVLEGREPVVKADRMEDFQNLQKALLETFGAKGISKKLSERSGSMH
jgi:hypothetical protein